MLDARTVVEEIRADLAPLERRILAHAYLAGLEAGELPRVALKIFAGQQHDIITSDLRSLALLLSRHGHLASRVFLQNVLAGEAAALTALGGFAQALGMKQAELEAFEPLPAAHAYCGYVAWLGLYGSDAELAGAFLVNLAAWGTNCGRMSRALKQNYGMSNSDVAFFDLFANLPPSEDAALAVIQAGLERGIAARLIHRAARMLQSYELMYWDAMAEAAGLQARE